MSRNFGFATRDMASAGRQAMTLLGQKRGASFATIDVVSQRWCRFVAFTKEHDVGRMERITPQLLVEYGHQIADLVRRGEMKPTYGHVLISAVNSVMTTATRGAWRSVSPVRDCGIQKRTAIRASPPSAVDRLSFETVLPFIRNAAGERGLAIVMLARELGLRSEEASLINAKEVLSDALRNGVVRIEAGTKGGRPRTLAVTSERQITALRAAADAQGKDRSLVPSNKNFVQFLNSELRTVRETLKAHGIPGLHELRASYACARYLELTGHTAPCCGGKISDRFVDRSARLLISRELGHRRIDVVSAYVGSRKWR
jgi:hypothetical protein